jgi:pSer/pThr/pTyr-binding forkhead associated (FHA) protein
VSYENNAWRLDDQQSGNGVYVNDRRVTTASIDSSVILRLGPDGPTVSIEVVPLGALAPHPVARKPIGETMMIASYAERYFGTATDEDAEPIGGRTLMIRKAFQHVQSRQRRRYGAAIVAAVAAAIAAAAYAYYGHRQLTQQKIVAEDLFYTMKSLDVEIANVERLVASSGNPQGKDQVARYLERRRQLENNYDHFLAGLKLYDHVLTPQEQAILRVTRLFGECDMAAPPEYLAEVGSYVRRWQSTAKFAQSVARAQEKGYTHRIVEAFQRQNLPPQFFYLALQESGFDEFASGPPTYAGIAKGMWQFVPDTAKQYGLSVGPLAAVRKPDPVDDRHHWEKATDAAARYIRDIYSTDAQASGLLVMASYNWGERRVVNILRTMPANPRQRNFWKLLEEHRESVPKQTYDYVLSIVSAAAIGENPRLFGVAVNNPLAFLDAP